MLEVAGSSPDVMHMQYICFFGYVPVHTGTSGHDPSEFSFLEIRAVCTDINWVDTSQDQVPITLISKS